MENQKNEKGNKMDYFIITVHVAYIFFSPCLYLLSLHLVYTRLGWNVGPLMIITAGNIYEIFVCNVRVLVRVCILEYLSCPLIINALAMRFLLLVVTYFGRGFCDNRMKLALRRRECDEVAARLRIIKNSSKPTDRTVRTEFLGICERHCRNN